MMVLRSSVELFEYQLKEAQPAKRKRREKKNGVVPKKVECFFHSWMGVTQKRGFSFDGSAGVSLSSAFLRLSVISVFLVVVSFFLPIFVNPSMVPRLCEQGLDGPAAFSGSTVRGNSLLKMRLWLFRKGGAGVRFYPFPLVFSRLDLNRTGTSIPMDRVHRSL